MPATPPDALSPGSTLGDCRVIRVLGKGGFAVTYLARSPRYGTVAIKEFIPDGIATRGSDGMVRRLKGADPADYRFLLDQFNREADRICSFDHPGVVKGLTHQPSGEGSILVMRYLSGLTLRQHLRERHGGFAVQPAPVAALVTRLLDALSYIHERHVLHCDLKPGNIFLGQDFAPVLIDFGAARHSYHERCFSDNERLQSFTPYYAPLELMPGATSDMGPWTDIYEVAAVFYRCLTGGKIPAADDRARVAKDDPFMPLTAYFERESEWPVEFLRLIDWALELRPEARPQSVREWQRRLAPVLQTMLRTRPPDISVRKDPPDAERLPDRKNSEAEEVPSTWTVVTTRRHDKPPPDISVFTPSGRRGLPGLLVLMVILLIVTLVILLLRLPP